MARVRQHSAYWSHLELQKLGEVHKDTQTDDETEEGHPAERLLEGREDGPGPLNGDDDHHVDGAGDGHVLRYLGQTTVMSSSKMLTLMA